MNRRYSSLLKLALCAVLATTTGVAPAWAEEPSAAEVVKALLAAFNDHSPERMAELVSEDFELFYVAESETTLGLRGPEALQTEMRGYFGNLPTVRSEAEISVASGSYVAFKETVSWQHEGEERSQLSLVVYQVRDGKIRRAWYYPAER
ncbi:MAG: nuclear transport factor 2 family protein [bacterium]|nr:nuclear transport factor 2 family protein [bacterium]